jgi:uncharacterized iron-regulated protein
MGTLIGALASAGCAVHGPPPATTPLPVQPAAHTGSGHTPHRVYDTGTAAFVDFETLAARAASVDVVFFGEQHGHVPGHRMQHALLEAVGRRTDASLSMEMFERDVAHLVAGYAATTIELAAFLAGARPWPRYFPDYHPLVEEARSRGWPVIAANVPRTIAAQVAQGGLAALDTLDTHTRGWAAAELYCPDDSYRARFLEAMARHPSVYGVADPAAQAAQLQRYYEAQCVKDETMAESITEALRRGTARPVIHVTGAFHTDHGDGIPARVRRREPALTMLSITVVPVENLDTADPGPHRTRADYLLFTIREPRTP